MAILIAAPAQAIVDVSTPDNITPLGADSGWESVTSGGGVNYTYLGDSWVLTTGSYCGLPAQFSTGSFSPIPNQDFLVPNPAGWPGLSSESDLRLVRINGDPGVPAATLAAEQPPLGGEVVFIGQGLGREAEQAHWKVTKYNETNWVWKPVPSGGDYHGYVAAGSVQKRWGTNLIADEDRVLTRNGRKVVSLMTTFDSPGVAHEAQMITGDAGSAVFYDRDGLWELAGLVVSPAADLLYPEQLATWAVFGNATAFVDISVYHDEILAIMNSHREYSVMGDIDLDGMVWDGTGELAEDPDIAAFVDGWMAYDYGSGVGDIASWQRGDLNLDGRTDVEDFLLLRGALTQAAVSSLASALGTRPVAVPELSSAALAHLGVALAAGRVRRRRTPH